MPRPCCSIHPFSPETCAFCRKARDHAGYRARWGEEGASPTAEVTCSVRRCPARAMWKWQVKEGDWMRACGEEADEAEAWEEANAVVQSLKSPHTSHLE